MHHVHGGVSGLRRAKDGYVMFSLPAGRITDWFKAVLGVEEFTTENVSDWVRQRPVEEVVELLGLNSEKVEELRRQGVI